MVTQGGVVFLATTYDTTLRAINGAGGHEVWTRELPAGAHSTPMEYRLGDADYVVVTAGRRLSRREGRGDFVIAFRRSGVTRRPPASQPTRSF